MKKLTPLLLGLFLTVTFVATVDAGNRQWNDLYEEAQNNFRAGNLTTSLSVARGALKKADIEYGSYSLNSLKSVELLAELTSASGAYQESSRWYRKAIEIQTRLFGKLHPNTARLMEVLATVELGQGNDTEAGRLYSLSIETAMLSGHVADPCIAESLIGLSKIQKMANKNEESEENLLEALNILENLTKYRPSLALSVANARVCLAETLKAQSRYTESNAQYRAAIRYFETRGISCLKPMTDSLVAMGDSYVSSNRKARALDCYKRALAATASIHPDDNITVALISRRIAGVYRTNGNIPEARRYFKKAISSLETCSPANCPLLADTKRSFQDLIEKTSPPGSDTPA